MIDVREAGSDDIPVLLEFAAKFHAVSGYANVVSYNCDSMEDLLTYLIESVTGALFVAELDNKLVGFIGLVKTPVFFNRNYSIAQELFWWVKEDYRQCGAGSILVKEAQLWAIEKSCSGILMASLDSSPELGDYYIANNYNPAEKFYMRKL